MNQYQQPHSPTYHHQKLFSKNNLIYQQLVQEDYLNDHSYTQTKEKTSHAAQIKFSHAPSYPIKIAKEPEYAYEREDFSPKLPKSNNLFKGFEPSIGRASNHATQSLSSNYCITEHENEENSTVNLYSLSRNHIQPDLQLSSNNITAKINEENDSQAGEQKTIRNDNQILQASILNNNSIANEDSSELKSQKIKKYRSEEYAHMPYTHDYSQDDEDGKIPKVLVDKYLKNDLTRKFSTSHNSEHEVQNSFKTVLNQIHVVPYKINNQIKPYAFSVPIESKQPSNQNKTVATSIVQNDHRKAAKANSLNLKNSNTSQDNEEETTVPTRHLYFSNHTHLNLHQNRATTHLIVHQPQSEAAKTRPAPRSEPKYNHTNNDKNTRSNSIECKSKPNVVARQAIYQHEISKNPQAKQHLQQSHVTKIFKNNALLEDHLSPQQSSIIYESSGITLCCSLSKDTEPQANKINFMTRPKEQRQQNKLTDQSVSPFFCSSIDMTKVSTLQNPKGNYKINPIQMIREMNESEGQRGIKLIGFPSKKEKF